MANGVVAIWASGRKIRMGLPAVFTMRSLVPQRSHNRVSRVDHALIIPAASGAVAFPSLIINYNANSFGMLGLPRAIGYDVATQRKNLLPEGCQYLFRRGSVSMVTVSSIRTGDADVIATAKQLLNDAQVIRAMLHGTIADRSEIRDSYKLLVSEWREQLAQLGHTRWLCN
jgi:hypothetical protein